MRTFLASLCALTTGVGTLFLLHAPDASVTLRAAVSLCGALTILLARRAWTPQELSWSHGSAGFARREEVGDLLVSAPAPLPFASILLGRKGKDLIALPRPYTGQHGLIVGGSGTGKSFGFFLPNMAIARDISCIVTDPKSEIWRYTSGFHQSTRFSPTEPGRR